MKCCFRSFDSKDLNTMIRNYLSERISEAICLIHSHFVTAVKQPPKKGRHNRVVYFALFFQTGFNEQVTQSYVGTKHGYNPKSVDSKCKKLKQR